jgi:hypothetical protein
VSRLSSILFGQKFMVSPANIMENVAAKTPKAAIQK